MRAQTPRDILTTELHHDWSVPVLVHAEAKQDQAVDNSHAAVVKPALTPFLSAAMTRHWNEAGMAS